MDSSNEEPLDRSVDGPPDGSDVDFEEARRGVRLLLEATGHDPDEDELAETWQRRAPAAFETLTAGNREAEKPAMRTFEAEEGTVVRKHGVPFYSTCEHHLLPFFGTADVAYEPRGEVVGLSKITRYVRWCSRQFTMQERLTRDIATGIKDELDARAVRVELSATHMCEMMRGVETESETVTEFTAGDFSEGV